MLWVNKWKPISSAQVVGNPGPVRTLRQWLETWDGNPGKKAVLLSGAPGIGKTTAAHIVAKECGFEVVEVNASDARNMSDVDARAGIGGKLANTVRELVTNRSLLGKPQVLIMDEVDGMSSGDRGGVQDLVQTIARSKIPIICICNDKYSQKLSALRAKCMELDFHPPTEDAVVRRMVTVMTATGLDVDVFAMRELVRSANGDLRQVISQLQLGGATSAVKDVGVNIFECVRRLLAPAAAAAAATSVADRMELVFTDADILPMMVAENYVNHRPVATPDPMCALANAADCISAGDVLHTAARRGQSWGLLPAAVAVGTVLSATCARGPRETFNMYPGEQNRPRFTSWLGNYSVGGKQRRLMGELTTAMAASGNVTGSVRTVRFDYVPALRHLLTCPLRQRGAAAIPDVVGLMREYCVNREKFDYVMDVTRFKTKSAWGDDPMRGVPTKVKSAFTRRLNKAH